MFTYTDTERATDFQFFLNHYNELFQKYGHKFIVIRNQKILGVYEDVASAIDATVQTYPLGTFIVQECNGDESGYTNYLSSWQLIEI